MTHLDWILPGEGITQPLRLKTRLRAWWEGYDLSGLQLISPTAASDAQPAAQVVTAAEAQDSGPLDRYGRPLWQAERLKVAETLWGQDFTSPGGVAHTAYLVKPFGINSAMSILDLGAGLGGVIRTIASEYKAWTTGMEASPLLARLGHERSLKAGLGKEAPIEHYDPEALKLTRRYDGIFAKEAFFTVQNKDALFDAIAGGLKPGGQFVFTDYCLEQADLTHPLLVSWLSNEPQEPHPWTAERLVKALKTRKLDVRTNEDITPLQKQMILQALAGFTQQLQSYGLDTPTKKAVLEEVEIWARRMAAFEAGLRVYRFYCMKH